MRIRIETFLNLKTDEAKAKVAKAAKEAMVDAVVAIAHDAIELSPVLTGNNRRSIKYEVGPGEIASKETEGAVYSTSGYGGFLETGTVKRSATPYFKPALDKNINKLPEGIKAHLE